jgi:very-short-patch-repair endonuclease
LNRTHNPTLKPYAQRLRRDMTGEERHLWYDFLNRLPVRFNRQKVIGPYIVDFYCASAKLVVELDGSQHCEEAGIAADERRDTFLAEQGLRVLRYTNVDVHRNFNGVCEDILKHL